MTAALALEGVSKNYRIAGRPTVAVDGVVHAQRVQAQQERMG